MNVSFQLNAIVWYQIITQ